MAVRQSNHHNKGKFPTADFEILEDMLQNYITKLHIACTNCRPSSPLGLGAKKDQGCFRRLSCIWQTRNLIGLPSNYYSHILNNNFKPPAIAET